MANFEQKKMNIKNINGGQKFTSGSQLTPDALNVVVEGLNLIDKKFAQRNATGKDTFIADNGTLNGNNIADNRAIEIANTQSIGLDVGALRFWSVSNGGKYFLDVSPTIPDNSHEKATLGKQNSFQFIKADIIKGDTVQGGVVQADNGALNGNNIADNRAIKIANTQSIGLNEGALRFWSVSNGGKYFLDVSPTIPDNNHDRATLGKENPFQFIKADMIQTGDEKLSVKELWRGSERELKFTDVPDLNKYKLIIANSFYQYNAGVYFTFSDLIFINSGKAYDLNESDRIRHLLTGKDKHLDVRHSNSCFELDLEKDDYANCGYEAIYGVLLK